MSKYDMANERGSETQTYVVDLRNEYVHYIYESAVGTLNVKIIRQDDYRHLLN